MKGKKPGKLGWVRYEIILMILLIGCISYCVTYESIRTHDNAISITELGTISILHEEDVINTYREQGRPIIDFHHDACQFITVYNSDESLKSIVMLSDVEPLYDQINNTRDWWPIFNSSESGKIDMSNEGVDITIHYQWVKFDNDTKFLVVYNINDTADFIFNSFTAVSYITLILSFILLINSIYWRYHGISSRYKQVNAEMKEIIRNQ